MSIFGKSIGKLGIIYGFAHIDGKGDTEIWKMKMEAVLKKKKTFKIVSIHGKLKDIEANVLEEKEDEALTTI